MNIKTIDELLKAIADKKYKIEVRTIRDDEKISKEEHKENAAYFQSLMENNREVFGDYTVAVKEHALCTNLYLYTFHIENDYYVYKMDVNQQGEKIGETCDFCINKIKCSIEKEPLCMVDEEKNRKAVESLNRKFQFHYPREKVEELLTEEGFQKKEAFDIPGYYLKGKWTKGNLEVSIGE